MALFHGHRFRHLIVVNSTSRYVFETFMMLFADVLEANVTRMYEDCRKYQKCLENTL